MCACAETTSCPTHLRQTAPDPLSACIRSHLAAKDYDASAAALVAVVDKCDAMRAESTPGGVGHFFADEFEDVIARALGLIS